MIDMGKLTGQVSIADALAIIAGIKLADTVGDMLNRQFPMLGGYGGLAAGFLLANYGDRVHPALQKFGQGVFLEKAGDALDPWFEQIRAMIAPLPARR